MRGLGVAARVPIRGRAWAFSGAQLAAEVETKLRAGKSFVRPDARFARLRPRRNETWAAFANGGPVRFLYKGRRFLARALSGTALGGKALGGSPR
jgi:hypothetical protein